MTKYDEEMIADVAYDVGNVDMLILCLISCRNEKATLRTRLQKSSLIYNQAYGSGTSHTPYYFGGYSDDIDESSRSLADIGLLSETPNGFKLTGFGSAVVEYKKNEDETCAVMSDRTMKLNKSLEDIDDRSLVAITYSLFPELAANSTIRESMTNLLKNMHLNGKHISEWTGQDFLDGIKNGTRFGIKGV